MTKLEPSVLNLHFIGVNVPPTGAVEKTIDLSQVASIVNRRFYRQGLNWAVGGFKLLTTSQTGFVSIQKLPNTWVMSGAWHKSFATWMRMNREALEESPSVRPRFLDFKVFADSVHHQAGFGANLLPNNPAATVIPGEWAHSSIFIPNAQPVSPGAPTGTFNEFDLIATGANYPGVSPVTTNDAVSLIEGYAASRGLPNILDPNTPDDADDAFGATPENWMSGMFNDGTVVDGEVLEDMISENNIAPYPFENDGVNLVTMYPGGADQTPGLEIHSTDYITGTTIGGTTRVRGGNFPCGLIRVVIGNDDVSEEMSWTLQVELIPGTHRGYLAESMQDM
jgi:hypothetical protein